MELGLVIALTATVINISLGAFVYFQDTKSKTAKVFALTVAVTCAWIISASISELPSVGFAINNAANSIAFAAGYLVLICAMIFTYVFPVMKVPKKSTLLILILVSVLSIYLSLTSLVSGAADKVANGVVEFSVGRLVWVYVILFMIPLVILARNLFSRMRRGIALKQRRQARLVLIAFVGTSLLGIIPNLIIPTLTGNWQSTQFGPLAIIFMTTVLVYAMVRHGLFDVRLIVARSLGYILSITALALVYFALAYAISIIFFKDSTTTGISISPINIALSLVLAFAFQPLKRFFDRITNFIFYRDMYNVEEFFARLTKRLSIITNLDVLLRYSSSEISNTLKASFGAFYIHQIDKPSVYISTEKGKKLPQQDVQMLDVYVLNNRKDIIVTEQLLDKDLRGLKRMLDSHHIALTLPITKDSIVTGYLFLGEHLSSQYTTRDIRSLLTIADELMIAIQNALSVQAIRELNESLQHRVDVATKELRSSNAMLRRLDKSKDDFISMASHQLRTPLTSIKGYISMVREGDVGKISKPQDELLSEAFNSSERMVHLINDFLNVSRLQTGKFLIDKHPVDLARIIDQELDSLMTNAKSRKLSFSYKPPKDFPILNLDEDKIRQVIMNFSDNAIYYSGDGTKIKVTLAVEGKDAVFKVIDTGIGVPRAEQSQLFNKFYRASNAKQQRPDGTGVGLYLAKKVIDAHDGTVVFESSEGKGSTFGFRLPIQESGVRSDADDLKNQDDKR
ncbi:hypothetical protein BH10PAT4_BH10PAT4_2790 [soil metagenome]